VSDLDRTNVAEGESESKVYRVATVVQLMFVAAILYFTISFANSAVTAIRHERFVGFIVLALGDGLILWCWHHFVKYVPREIVIHRDGTFDMRGLRQWRTFQASEVTSIHIRAGRPAKLVVAGKPFRLGFPNNDDVVRDLLQLEPSILLEGRMRTPTEAQRLERRQRRSRWSWIPLSVSFIGLVGFELAEHYGRDDKPWLLLCIGGTLGVVLVAVVDRWRNR